MSTDKQANWKVTATTIYCNAVADEVTILVHKGWSTECTGYHKHGGTSKKSLSQLQKRSRQLKRQLGCLGPECQLVTEYKVKLQSE